MRHAQRQAVPAFGKTPEHPLLYRDALGQVTGLVDVAAAQDGDLAGEQLQRDTRRDGAEHVADCRHADDAVGNLVDLLVALGITSSTRNVDMVTFANGDRGMKKPAA